MYWKRYIPVPSRQPLIVIPIQAPVQQDTFNLVNTIIQSIDTAGESLQTGDVVAISSKYAAISEGRVVNLHDVQISPQAQAIAERYHMNPHLAQLVLNEADHVFGGIIHEFNGVKVGFLLTHKDGIISPNAGLDRSNIPSGQVVLFPIDPYHTAAHIRAGLRAALNVDVGVILTDSWLMPGRLGTTGVALSTAGFKPIRDQRGKPDLFGNPMQVTQIGIADSICVCAQMVMGETDEATPIAIVRNTGVELTDAVLGVDDVAIPWQMCIYVGSLTEGRLTQDLLTANIIAGD
ncbi:MAG: cytidine deaminase [Phototrophicales bacterium]|nr:MAG: cytidine deaminase [Phototrophicales bacterium]RMG77137.1 MAG: cytidine deaminase [Chloroflexota bacterium]